ncbi:predicted protein [Sclerotinia sclerotiorum 1980 UF-70]|uniref:Uncharacterized protein n=1 Tax=Sclerotinia sclerotiorum (strain ATCC 18683 / 1980 / Ss-1) TaxID=665079 RepID=A7F3D0_SCLS1|nr:predicted protein [Sclerotinia sclerotiorum 1980 UF-70]EDN97251.1 predicted protein [Sclerotinia sclerotiorum 1980 UF-70]
MGRTQSQWENVVGADSASLKIVKTYTYIESLTDSVQIVVTK